MTIIGKLSILHQNNDVIITSEVIEEGIFEPYSNYTKLDDGYREVTRTLTDNKILTVIKQQKSYDSLISLINQQEHLTCCVDPFYLNIDLIMENNELLFKLPDSIETKDWIKEFKSENNTISYIFTKK